VALFRKVFASYSVFFFSEVALFRKVFGSHSVYFFLEVALFRKVFASYSVYFFPEVPLLVGGTKGEQNVNKTRTLSSPRRRFSYVSF
jgi:hypothetical protein